MADPYSNVLTSERFKKLYAMPEFQRMDYENQQIMKERLFQDIVSKWDKWAGFNQQERQAIYDRYVAQSPPAFEDQRYYQYVGNMENGGSGVLNSFSQGFVRPFLQGSVLAHGAVGLSQQIQNLLKSTGLVSQDMPSTWNMVYGNDASKLSNYVINRNNLGLLAEAGNLAGMVFDFSTMRGVGEIAATGVGPASRLSARIASSAAKRLATKEAIAAGASKLVAKDIGARAAAETMARLVPEYKGVLGVTQRMVSGLENVLGGNIQSPVAREFAKWVSRGGIRTFFFRDMAPGVLRATGSGSLFGVQQLALDMASQRKLEFSRIATNFGLGFAGDALMNSVMASIFPFMKATMKSIFKGVEVTSLRAAEEMNPVAFAAMARDAKLGILPAETRNLLDQATQDHLDSLVHYDLFNTGRLGGVPRSPENAARAWGFHTGLDIIPTEAGGFRMREWPGILTKTDKEGHIVAQASRILEENASLATVNRIVAGRYAALKSSLERTIDIASTGIAKASEKLAKADPGSEEALIAAEQRDENMRVLHGAQQTLDGLQTGPARDLEPIAQIISRTEDTFDVAKREGLIPPSRRMALTYSEAEAAIQSDVSNSVKFLQVMEPGTITGRERKIVPSQGEEARGAKVESILREAFVKSDAPFRVVPAQAGDYNAVALYGKALQEGVGWKSIVRDAQVLKSKDPTLRSSVDEIAQSMALSEGYDAIKMDDGSITLLLPRIQVRHVSDKYNPKTGRYMRGPDNPRAGSTENFSFGPSQDFLRSLKNQIVLKQALHLNVRDEDLANSDRASMMILSKIYGNVDPALVKKASELYLGEGNIVRVKLVPDMKMDQITVLPPKEEIHGTAKGKPLYEIRVPSKILTPQEQQDFLVTLGERLAVVQRSAMSHRIVEDLYTGIVNNLKQKKVTEKEPTLKLVQMDEFGNLSPEQAIIERSFEAPKLTEDVLTSPDIVISRIRTEAGPLASKLGESGGSRILFKVSRGEGLEEIGRFDSLQEARRVAASKKGEKGNIYEDWKGGATAAQEGWRRSGIQMPSDKRAAGMWGLISAENAVTRIEKLRIKAAGSKGKLKPPAPPSETLKLRVGNLSSAGTILREMGKSWSNPEIVKEAINQIRANLGSPGWLEIPKEGFVIEVNGRPVGRGATKAEAEAMLLDLSTSIPKGNEIEILHYEETRLLGDLNEKVLNIPEGTEMTAEVKVLMRSILAGDRAAILDSLNNVQELAAKSRPPGAVESRPGTKTGITPEYGTEEVPVASEKEITYSHRFPPISKEFMTTEEIVKGYEPLIQELTTIEGKVDEDQVMSIVGRMLGEDAEVYVRKVEGLDPKDVKLIKEEKYGYPESKKKVVLVVPAEIDAPWRIFKYPGEIPRTWILRAEKGAGKVTDRDVVIRQVERADGSIVYVLHKGLGGVHEVIPGVKGEIKTLDAAEFLARDYASQTGGKVWKTWSEVSEKDVSRLEEMQPEADITPEAPYKMPAMPGSKESEKIQRIKRPTYYVYKGNTLLTMGEDGKPKGVNLEQAKKIAKEATDDGLVYMEGKKEIPRTKIGNAYPRGELQYAKWGVKARTKRSMFVLSEAGEAQFLNDPVDMYGVVSPDKSMVGRDIPDLEKAVKLAQEDAKAFGKPDSEVLLTWMKGEVGTETRKFTKRITKVVAEFKREGMEFVGETFQKAVEDLVEKFPGMTSLAQVVKRKNLMTAPLPEATEAQKVAWLQEAIKKNKDTKPLRKPGDIEMRRPGYPSGKTSVERLYTLEWVNGRVSPIRGTIDEVIDQYLVAHTEFPIVRNELIDVGVKLTRKTMKPVHGQTMYTYEAYYPGEKKPRYTSTDLPTMLEQLDFRPSRINGKFAADNVAITPTGVTFEVRGQFAMGSQADVARYLDRFYDASEEAKKKVVERTPLGKVVTFTGSDYVVEIPGWGLRKDFPSIEKAREYVRGELFTKFLEMDNIARSRNYVLTFTDKPGFRYKLVNETGTFYAKDEAEVGSILSRHPDPGFAPNLFKGISEADLEKFAAEYKKGVLTGRDWNMPENFNPKDLLSTNLRFITPMAPWVEAVARKTGLTKLLELWQELDRTYQTAMTMTNRMRQILLTHLTEKTPSGMMGWGIVTEGKAKKKRLRLYPKEKRAGMAMWLEAVTDEQRENIVKVMGLEEKHIESARKIREILGEKPTEGLYATFGINPNEFLFRYLPRIREAAIKMGYGPNITSLDDSQLQKAFTYAGVPGEFKFWAEYSRLSDMVNFSREHDLARLVLRYNEQGHKKLLLNPVWKRMDEYLATAPVGDIISQEMKTYREMVMGSFMTNPEKMVKQFGTEFAKAFGFKDPQVGGQISDLIFTMNTLTSQAFRPWLTFRNMLQIFSTGSVLLDEKYFLEGLKHVSKNAPTEVARGILLGVVKEAPPLLNEIVKGEGGFTKLVGELTEKGMGMMSRSDAIQRMVVYKGSELQFDAEFARFTKLYGNYSSMDDATKARMHQAMGLNLASQGIQQQIAGLLSKGDGLSYRSAKHLFGDNLQKLTMFDYSKPNAAPISRGLVGKAFGQYQTFPLYYISMVKHLLTHGTAAQKAKMVAKLAGVAFGIYAGLEAIGIEGSNFMPWVPAQVTGGPLFNLMIEGMRSTDTTSYRGRQARGEIKGILAGLIPGTYEYRMASNFLKYMERGDVGLAFLAATSAPIRSDLR